MTGTATATANWGGDASHGLAARSGSFTIGKASSVVAVGCTAGAPHTYTGRRRRPARRRRRVRVARWM